MQLTPEEKTVILTFMQNNPMAVISTSDAKTGHPESALIAFAETENLEIIFETFDVARKYENLRAHPNVAFVIGWDLGVHCTLQCEGEAHEVLEENEREACVRLMLAKDTPCTKKFLRDPHVKFFKVTPRWMRFSDYSKHPTMIIEGEC